MAQSSDAMLEKLTNRDYQYGFVTDIDSDTAPPGLNEDIVRLISTKKNEPQWLLDWRLKALVRFMDMLENDVEPTWASVKYPKINYQDIIYYSAPKNSEQIESLDQLDPHRCDCVSLRDRRLSQVEDLGVGDRGRRHRVSLERGIPAGSGRCQQLEQGSG